MKTMMRMTLAAAVSLVALEASAGGFAVREQSATSQGVSFAGAATSAAGLSGMFWNPAVVTQVPGINFDSHYSLIMGFAKITPTTGSGAAISPLGSGNLAVPAIVPASYGSYQVNDRIFLGLSINSPFGLKTKSDYNWGGQIYGRSSKAFNVVATPTVGVKLNDWLAIGVGVQVSYLDVTLKGAVSPAPNASNGIISGDAWGVGYTLGATITPMAGTEIGIGFRSHIRHNLEGSFSTLAGSLPIKVAANTPETVTVGLKQTLTKDVTLLAGFEWVNWSRIRNPGIRYAVPAPASAPKSMPFFYKDSWMASLGAEYKLNAATTLRAGLAYEKSPISDEVRAVRIPDNNRLWASIGATYQWNHQISIDLGYTHIFVKRPDVNIVAGHPDFKGAPVALVGRGKAHVDILTLGLRYRFDEPKPRASVTKG